jgi:hypothetical protein
VKLWSDADLETFQPFVNQKYFLQAENKGMQSDIWRYEVSVCFIQKV